MNIILLAVDFSDVTSRAVEFVQSIALKAGCSVQLLHVAAPDPEFVTYEVGPANERTWRAEALHKERGALESYVDLLRAAGVDAVSVMRQGPTVDKILEVADHVDADIIVLGSHGHGALYDLVVGSVAEAVLRRSPIPVLLIPCLA